MPGSRALLTASGSLARLDSSNGGGSGVARGCTSDAQQAAALAASTGPASPFAAESQDAAPADAIPLAAAEHAPPLLAQPLSEAAGPAAATPAEASPFAAAGMSPFATATDPAAESLFVVALGEASPLDVTTPSAGDASPFAAAASIDTSASNAAAAPFDAAAAAATRAGSLTMARQPSALPSRQASAPAQQAHVSAMGTANGAAHVDATTDPLLGSLDMTHVEPLQCQPPASSLAKGKASTPTARPAGT